MSPNGNIKLHEERSLVCVVHCRISELDYVYMCVGVGEGNTVEGRGGEK